MTKKDPNINEASEPEEAEKRMAPKKPDDASHRAIYDAVMRGGGEPFGAPWGLGLATLTLRIVKRFKQKGFFAFESLERLKPKNKRNKFTRAGASRFWGPYEKK